MQDRRAEAESPDPPDRLTRLVAQLERALEKKHGWKRAADDPADATDTVTPRLTARARAFQQAFATDADTAAALAAAGDLKSGTTVTVPSRQVDTLTVTWTSSESTPRAVGYHVRRPREHRPGTSRRTSSSSRTSSSDPGDESDEPEPPSSGRLCAGGCGRDISHKRPNAKTCGSDRCKKRAQRSAVRSSWIDLVGEIQRVEDRIEELLLERQEKWRTAARDGGHRFLTTVLADELQEQFAERARLLAQYVRDAHSAQPCPGHDEQRRPELVADGHCLKCGRGIVASYGCRTTGGVRTAAGAAHGVHPRPLADREGCVMIEQILTAEQLAARWQVRRSQVYRLTRDGALPAVKLGRYYRYRLDAIEQFERDGGARESRVAA